MTKKFTGVLVIVIAVIAVAGIVCLYTRSFSSSKHEETKQKAPADMLPPEQPAPSVASKSSALEVPPHTAHDKSPTPEMKIMQTKSTEELIADGKDAMSRKAYDKAREMLEEAYIASTDPDQRMSVGMMLYECLVRTQAYDDALVLGKELLTLSPSPQERLTLTQQLAALLHRMGKPAEAEALLTQTAKSEKDPATQEKLNAQLRGVWRHTPGRTAEVVSNLTQKVAANPNDEAALLELGEIYIKSRRNYKAAQPVYEQLAAMHPEDAEVQRTLLGIYRQTENFAGIRRVYEAQLAQTGEDPTLRFQIAQTELQAGRGDEAVAYAEQHLSGDTATPFQLQMLSTVYDKSGRKDAALATLDTAIVRETNAQQRVSMQFQKAEMLIWNKQYTEVETLLRSIIQAAVDDQQTISRAKGEIVRIYEMQGKMNELNM